MNRENPSIECSVHQCRFHCADRNYCSLDKIRVSTNEPNPSQCECTNCASFQKKSYHC